jgi:integrase
MSCGETLVTEQSSTQLVTFLLLGSVKSLQAQPAGPEQTRIAAAILRQGPPRCELENHAAFRMQGHEIGMVSPELVKVKQGKTPVLTADEAKQLLASIIPDKKQEDGTDVAEEEKEEDKKLPPTIGQLRDRALIAVMVFSFARVSAALAMKVEDYYTEGRRAWFRLHEKGGKRHKVPARHNAEKYVDAYLDAAGIAGQKKTPLFRSIDTHRKLTDRPMDRNDALRMIKRWAKAADLSEEVCCHTFRATGITAYLEGGGTIEHAQQIANHESPKTTKLYDRTSDRIDLDEIEKIRI